MPAPRCHYATDVAVRPDCQVTAVLRRGTVPLCASCDARRSTLGKGKASTPLPPAPPADLLAWAAQASRSLRAAEAELTAAALRARMQGCPWSAIAASLGITRQAAWQRFGPAASARPSPPERTRQKTTEVTSDTEVTMALIRA